MIESVIMRSVYSCRGPRARLINSPKCVSPIPKRAVNSASAANYATRDSVRLLNDSTGFSLHTDCARAREPLTVTLSASPPCYPSRNPIRRILRVSLAPASLSARARAQRNIDSSNALTQINDIEFNGALFSQ